MQSLHPPRRRSVLRARADDPAASDTVEVHAHGGLPVGEHWRTGLFSSCQRRCREVFAPGPIEKPENAKSPAGRGFSRCAEEDSNLHPVTRTRPSRRWALDRGVVLRTAASFLSAMENTLDTLDGVDVVRGVVAIRDQGVDKAGV